MWIFSTEGFYSIVNKEGHFQIRSRHRMDLERLKKLTGFLTIPVLHDRGTDYPVRMYLNAEQTAWALACLSKTITYPNFKNKMGTVRHQWRISNVLGTVWGMIHRQHSKFLSFLDPRIAYGPEDTWEDIVEREYDHPDQGTLFGHRVHEQTGQIQEPWDAGRELAKGKKPKNRKRKKRK